MVRVYVFCKYNYFPKRNRRRSINQASDTVVGNCVFIVLHRCTCYHILKFHYGNLIAVNLKGLPELVYYRPHGIDFAKPIIAPTTDVFTKFVVVVASIMREDIVDGVHVTIC